MVTTFWRSVGVVLSGTAVAQAIPLLGLLVLARLYTPSDFGFFATWFGVVQLGAVVATGRFEMALALEADGEERRVAVMATVVAIATASAIAVLIVAAGLFSGVTLGIHPLLLLLGVPAIALAALAQTLQGWAGADGRYGDLALVRVCQSLAITVGQVVAGLIAPTATTLAITQILGVLVGVVVALQCHPIKLRPPDRSWREAILDFWVRQRRFPLLSLPSDSVNNAAAQLPLLILASRFGADIVGQLALTMRVLGGPISLLGASVLDVFRRSVGQSWRDRGECRHEFNRTLRILATGSAGLVVAIGLYGESLFALAFGETWRAAGTIALWLLPMFALRFMASPLSYMFYVAGKQHVDLIWQLGLLSMTVATLTLSPGYQSALIAYSAGYTLLYVIYLALSYHFSGGVRQ